jgi:hypothetical protein
MRKSQVLLGGVKVVFNGVSILNHRDCELFYCLDERFLIKWKDRDSIQYVTRKHLSPGGAYEQIGRRIGVGVKSGDTRPVLPAPDGYRGDISCLTPNRKAGFIKGDRIVPPMRGAHIGYDIINVNTWQKVGVLLNWYGSGGEGKLAYSEFISSGE